MLFFFILLVLRKVSATACFPLLLFLTRTRTQIWQRYSCQLSHHHLMDSALFASRSLYSPVHSFGQVKSNGSSYHLSLFYFFLSFFSTSNSHSTASAQRVNIALSPQQSRKIPSRLVVFALFARHFAQQQQQ